jgi:hypothetical protein
MSLPGYWRRIPALPLAVVLGFGSGPAGADVFVDAAAVCPPCDGTAAAPFPTIQQGIDAAASGQTVIVAPGIYVENARIVGKVVHLLAGGAPSETVVDGGGTGSTILLDNAGGSSIEGFTITGGQAPFGGGVEVLGGLLPGAPTITRNLIVGNQAVEIDAGYDGDGGGIDLYLAAGAVVVDNLVQGNSAVRQGGGINAIDCDGAVIAFNTIVGNSATGNGTGLGPGISLVLGGSQVVANNIVASNTGKPGTGAVDVYEAGATVAGNLFHANQPADFVSTEGSLPPGNPNADPRFLDAPGGDFHIRLDSPAVDAAAPAAAAGPVDLDGNPRPVDAEATGQAVADAGCYEQLGQVAALGITTDGTISWTPAPVFPDLYHVYRSGRADLVAGNLGACQDDRDPILTDRFFQETETPAPGAMFAYVVQFERNGAFSSLGLASGGLDRTPGALCP